MTIPTMGSPIKLFALGAISLCSLWTIGTKAQTSESPKPSWRSQGIVNDAASPYAKVHSIPIRAVKMGDGFWLERMKINREKSIPTMLALLEEHGRVDNFRRLSGRSNAAQKGPVYADSDVYKWMEAVGNVLQSGDQPELRAKLDKEIDDVLAAQEPSGYLDTYYVGERAGRRFAEMYRSHELYCLGHLLQAAVAVYRATGDRKLLDGGIKYANYLVNKFGPDKEPALTGHPELEMALVELYRTTGDKRYLDFAGYLFTGEKQRLHLTDDQVRYMFSGIPFTSRKELEGHAVRALYACSGATDYYLETGDPAYHATLDRLWQDLVERKMYVTGGVGAVGEFEGFGPAYELPNEEAYAESCAAIASFMWNWRMLLASGQSKYADVMERALYNGINSGMSLAGTLYCYRNPLESRGDEEIRNPWYDTTCCPPNLERTFAALPGYLYATGPRSVYVNFYHNSTLQWVLEDGNSLELRQETKYPWEGDVTLTVAPAKPSEFGVYLRIPEWSRKTTVTVNGKPAPGTPKPGEYFLVQRGWNTADSIKVQFDMTPQVIAANPRVRDDLGRVAVQRGPLVYCLEQVDQPQQASIFDLALPLGPEPSQGFATQYRPEMLGGVVVLRHKGMATAKTLSDLPLYGTVSLFRQPAEKEVDLTFIPYYAWANRQSDAMEVWIPIHPTAPRTPPEARATREGETP